ncbi:S8/S53 family peptidase [Dactylosporangium sp. NBC_01737]|uniref:S8 family peptidase n=1 Tax=Dactylosporangium sp. NBC_01737 TaxID=2975959 RepID=UPI002E0F109E|nr:S8/S53 family peptidase [Dactylosporangium sp. NBC_01737]
MVRPLHDPQQRFWEQVDGIREHFTVAVGPPGTGTDPSLTPRYLAEDRYVLVREDDEEAVRQQIAVRSDEAPQRAHGLVRLPVAEDVPSAVRRLAAAHPNYMVTITPVNSCPADEPTLPPRPPRRSAYPPDPPPPPLLTPPRHPDEHAGRGVDVLVVDTGLVPDYQKHPTISDVKGGLRSPVPEGVVTQYYGHGTFIAGVLKNIAPGVRLTVSEELQHAGSISEFHLGERLLEALAVWQSSDGETGRWPDIISLSAGAPTEDDQPLRGLEEFIRQLEKHTETVLVAAAGNDGEPRQPFWPAALAPRYAESRAIVAVGALREDGVGRACFSNCGDWVSVYAEGERLVNTFTWGTYTNAHNNTRDCRYHVGYHPLYRDCTCVTAGAQGDRVEFDGFARWSGTSFATPIVAGRIARCMNLDGRPRTSRQAAQYLLSSRVHTIRDDADGLPLPVLCEEDRPPA